MKDGKIVGNIVYTHSKIIKEDGGEQSVVTFGPVSVLPEFQNQGIGGALIHHSIAKAKEMGIKAILIYGYPDYYKRFGFLGGKKFGISRSDGIFPKALQVLELFEGALRGINGKFIESAVFETNPEELEEFENLFTVKEKLETKSQEIFANMIDAMEED